MMTDPNDTPFVERCGARYGFWNATWPFVRFELTREHVRIDVFPLSTIRLAKSQVTRVRSAPRSWGGMIEIASPELVGGSIRVHLDWARMLPTLRRFGYPVDERDPDAVPAVDAARGAASRPPRRYGNPDDVDLDA